MENPPTTFIVSQRRIRPLRIRLSCWMTALSARYDELLAACPVYQEIYASQFKKEEGKQHG